MAAEGTGAAPSRPVEPAAAEVVKRRDAERTRQAIMAAALKEFAQFGYAGGRIERIARAAKCNIRMLYHYFGAKSGLYVAVLEAAYDDIRRKEAALRLDVEQPLESLLELMRFTFTYFQNNPQFEGLLRAENMMQGKFVVRSQPVAQAASVLKKTIGELIASGQAKGLFRDDLDPVQVCVTITALSRFHLANAYSMSAVMETDLRDKEWRRLRLRHALAVLEAYLVCNRTASASGPPASR